MRAIVLVGGEGTRLRPLTWRTPKSLVPVMNRPLLEHLLLHLKGHGVTDVTLAMTRRSEAIREAFGSGSRLGIKVDYAYEDTPLGSGGAIASVAAGWTETFLVCNGDVITDIDLSAVLDAHRRREAELTITLHEVEDPSPFGVVELGEDGRILRFVEKPIAAAAPSRLINAGTWVFEPHVLREMDATAFNRVEDGLFPGLAASNRGIHGVHLPAYWIDVGNPGALLRANLDMAARRRDVDGVVVPRDTQVAADARLDGPLVIGRDGVIEARARLGESLLWDGVHVGPAAQVRRSILATGVTIGAGAVLEDCVIAHGVTVEPEAHLSGASIEPEGVNSR